MQLLEQELIHFIASDSHSPQSRQFILKPVYEFLQDKISKEYLEKLFYVHPQMIINKTQIKPIQLPEEEKQGLFGAIRSRFKSQL